MNHINQDGNNFWNDDIHKKYSAGTDMRQFKHIPEVSYYDHNYYVGFDGELLYGQSDDDNTTEWYLVRGDNPSIYLGVSFTSDRDKLVQESNL